MDYFVSDLSGKQYSVKERVNLSSIRIGVFDLIQKDYPELNESKNISIGELDEYREKYIECYLKEEFGDKTKLEAELIENMKTDELISIDVDKVSEMHSTIGERIADKVADFGGSWKFIISFVVFMILWIIFNVYSLFNKSFDPYPFILLNLLLSCLAALQAPVIMMSQNRVEDRDRLRAKEDYKINLKSEIEIKALHEKFDHLVFNQQQRLFEIQDIQMSMLKEINTSLNALKDERQKMKTETLFHTR